jgi:hypothetical protein
VGAYTDNMNYGVRVRYVGVFPTWMFFIKYATYPDVSNHIQMPNRCDGHDIGYLHTIAYVIQNGHWETRLPFGI